MNKIIAIEIESERLRAGDSPKPCLWLALTDYFQSPDGSPVFYAEEIPALADKTTDQLKKIYEIKKIFPGSRVKPLNSLFDSAAIDALSAATKMYDQYAKQGGTLTPSPFGKPEKKEKE